MNTTIPYLGEAFSLTVAIVWAFAVILFKKSGETVHPIALNLFKNLLAIILFLPTMWLLGETLFLDVPARDYLILIISGALGIGIADTLFFNRRLRLGGDTELGLYVKNFLDSLELDDRIGPALKVMNGATSLIERLPKPPKLKLPFGRQS